MRWDESLPITDSFVELVLDALGYAEGQLPRGVALLFVAHAVPWLGGQRSWSWGRCVGCVYGVVMDMN